MNIQTVIANLLTTIDEREQVLKQLKRDAFREKGSDYAVTSALIIGVEIHLKQLNNILADCMAVREADIVKDLEIKDLKRQNSDYSWQVNPDRMGQ